MDLNFDLNLPPSPRSPSPDLASDLTPDPLPISSSPSFQEISTPLPPIHALHLFDETPNQERFLEPAPNLSPISRSTNMPADVPLIIRDDEHELPTVTPSRRRELRDHIESSIGANSKSLFEKKDDFECNICLEAAEEPVVTSCGHLFCWPCLYRWLHFYSDSEECPLCKGRVIESDIVPIYGKGDSSDSSDEKRRSEGGGDLDLEIPPRPRGKRVESLGPTAEVTLFLRTEELDRLLEAAETRIHNDERNRRRDFERVPSDGASASSSAAATDALAESNSGGQSTTLRRERSGTSDVDQ